METVLQGLAAFALLVGMMWLLHHRPRPRVLRRRLGLFLFGVVLLLLGEPVPTAHCDQCGRWVHALCKRHIDELAAEAAGQHS